VLKTHPEECIRKIKEDKPANYVDYITPIKSLAKFSDEFRFYIGESIDKYKDAFEEGRVLTGKNMLSKADTNEVICWESIVEKRKQIEKEHPYTSEHLLISLMTMMPTLRDDFGKMRLLKKNQFRLKNSEYNYYHIPTGKIHLYNYKNSRLKKKTEIDVPAPLRDIIERSLEQNPRDWLITQNKNTTNEIYAGGNLSGLVKKLFGFSINDIRHSLDTYIHYNPKISPSQALEIDAGMLHSSRMGWLYVRDGDVMGYESPFC
jgi:hypothetical protein